ncbi:hypothetical protein T11_11614 [Trichinella zimbabwensis]|uniref:Uncharacterized protein n=1 Tax=Trichinella zimbabwensis TaxID=268475 RepID=A0A0V1H208_9BILA|nr:hypothetical protein T11_11614 [Trichinella zimbabwensis]
MTLERRIVSKAVHICRPGCTKQAFCFAYSPLGEVRKSRSLCMQAADTTIAELVFLCAYEEKRALGKNVKTKMEKGHHIGQF